MLTDTLQFVLDTLLQSYAALLLLRFHMQWLRSPMRNPLGDFVMLLTNPLVLRARRYIPTAWGLDSASLLLAAVVEMLYLAATLYLHSFPISVPPLFAWMLVKLLKLSVYLLMGALFIEALLSWTNPHTPLAAVLSSITRPFLRSLRRFVPPAGGIDFSFLILFFVCQLILMLPLAWLEGLVLRAL